MTRPIVERRRARGPSEIKDRQRKDAGASIARRFVGAFGAAVAGLHVETAIWAANYIIQAMSKFVETHGDIGRAHGCLGVAAAELSPAWTPDRAHEAAETVFRKVAA